MDNLTQDDYYVGVFTLILVSWIVRQRGRKITRALSPTRISERTRYLHRIIYESDIACIDMLRMNRELFFNLCQKFREKNLLEDSYYVSVEEQVAMFLHIVGHSVRGRVIGINFRRSIETVSRQFKNVLYAIGELRDEYMKPPSSEPSEVITSNSRFYPFFKNCIGAIDGTHIPISVASKDASRYRGRKHVPTQNVLAAVDFNLQFTYVLAGWEGTAHDALVLNNAMEREDNICIPEGKYYLADAGYSTLSF